VTSSREKPSGALNFLQVDRAIDPLQSPMYLHTSSIHAHYFGDQVSEDLATAFRFTRSEIQLKSSVTGTDTRYATIGTSKSVFGMQPLTALPYFAVSTLINVMQSTYSNVYWFV
jgi:hypothetical protein